MENHLNKVWEEVDVTKKNPVWEFVEVLKGILSKLLPNKTPDAKNFHWWTWYAPWWFPQEWRIKTDIKWSEEGKYKQWEN